MPRLDPNHPAAAVLAGALDRLRVRRRLPRLAPDERLDGRVALVTGGASGLGFATSVDLARRGARVLLADRLWAPLAEGGEALRPIDAYPWSERFGWVKDRFGVSWQAVPDGIAAWMASPDAAALERAFARK